MSYGPLPTRPRDEEQEGRDVLGIKYVIEGGNDVKTRWS